MLRKPVSTPLRFSCNEEAEKSKKTWTSRRRPTYAPSTSSLQKLHERKIEAIDAQQRVAESENKRASDHHELDLQIKKEKLKQEKLKSYSFTRFKIEEKTIIKCIMFVQHFHLTFFLLSLIIICFSQHINKKPLLIITIHYHFDKNHFDSVL